jgi:hexosaminidase
LVDVRDPCWTYRDADLGGIGHLAVSVAALPFNYQFADEATPRPFAPPSVPGGALIVRRGGCDGPVVATVPLTGAPGGGVESEHVAALPPGGPARADLCLRLERPDAARLWALGRVELRP